MTPFDEAIFHDLEEALENASDADIERLLADIARGDLDPKTPGKVTTLRQPVKPKLKACA